MSYEDPIERQNRLNANDAKRRAAATAAAGTAYEKLMRDNAQKTAARFDAQQAERGAALDAANTEAHNAELREGLRAAYINANGSDDGFDEAYPALRAAHVEALTLANVAPKPTGNKAVVNRLLEKRYRR